MTRVFLRLIPLISLGGFLIVLVSSAAGHQVIITNNDLIFTASFGAGDMSLYRMDMAHRLIVRLTHDNVLYSQPEWSHDGQTIAVTRADNGLTAIYLVNPDTGNGRPLTKMEHGDYSPTWSPDSRLVAYIRLEDAVTHLIITNIESGETHAIDDTGHVSNNAAWSPDGQLLAYSFMPTAQNYTTIFIHDFQNSIPDYPLAQTLDTGFFPSWSNDGNRLLFTRTGGEQGIYLWDRTSKEITRLYTPDGYVTSVPDWSPDDRYIVYSTFMANVYVGAGLWQLEVANCLPPTAACIPELLTHKSGDYADPRWRPHPS